MKITRPYLGGIYFDATSDNADGTREWYCGRDGPRSLVDYTATNARNLMGYPGES